MNIQASDLEVIRERVGNGIEFLNEELGNSWPWDLNTHDLDLRNMLYCVIGQLYGDEPGVWGGWQSFNEKHKPSLEWLTAHGFDDIHPENYILLTVEWNRRICKIVNA